MADDKTTKTPEQPVTDTGPGKETPPTPPKEPEKVSVSPEPEKKTEPEVKNPQVSVYNFTEIMKEKKAEERAAAPGVEKPDPAKTEKPEKQPEAPKKAEEKPKEPEQPKRRGRPPKADKDKAAAPKPKAPAQKPEKAVKKEPEKKAAPTVQAASAPKGPEKPKDAPRRGKEQIVYIKLNELHAFKNHPFEVRDDEEMRAIPDKHFTRLLAEYDEEQTGLEAAIAQWQEAIESWNADRLKTDKFIELVSRYTDFSELTTPMLNEFIEKVVVHEGEGRGNSRRQRIDIYLNFIGAFEVPAHIVTPMEAEEQRRQQEEQAAKEARSQELAKAREEKRKAEKREFTARKKAGLLTPEEQAADEARLAHNRAWQKEWRKKRKAAEPPKPPKPKSLKELAALQKAGADLTPEEAERLAAYRERKNRQHKAWYERQKAAQPPKPRTLKELAAAQVAGQPLTPEETERLEASRSRKKNAYQELKAQAETDPAAAAELARRRAYHSEATKKSRQKMYEEAAAGNPAAQARYENFLAARRENYHRKKHDEKGEQIA